MNNIDEICLNLIPNIQVLEMTNEDDYLMLEQEIKRINKKILKAINNCNNHLEVFVDYKFFLKLQDLYTKRGYTVTYNRIDGNLLNCVILLFKLY